MSEIDSSCTYTRKQLIDAGAKPPSDGKFFGYLAIDGIVFEPEYPLRYNNGELADDIVYESRLGDNKSLQSAVTHSRMEMRD